MYLKALHLIIDAICLNVCIFRLLDDFVDGWYVSIARCYWHHGGVASAIARARFPRCQLLTGFEFSHLKNKQVYGFNG